LGIMTLSDLRDAALEAFSYLAKGTSSSFPNAVFKHDEDTDIVWTGNNFVILNGAFWLSQPMGLAELEHTLKYVESQFRELDKGTGGIVVWKAGTLLENKSLNSLSRKLPQRMKSKQDSLPRWPAKEDCLVMSI
jgi:hypothetical protein